MKRLASIAMATLWIAGCGGNDSSGGSFQGGVPSPTGQTYSARVVDESGLPVGGVKVVVHERTNNAKGTAVTGADGNFQLTLAPGVYDLGLDLENDPNTATCFYGPFDTAALPNGDLVLHRHGGRSLEKVFGKIWLQPGLPAANRRIRLLPGASHTSELNKVSQPVALNTASDGTFELALDTQKETALDVEVYDGQQNLDEFIDIAKLKKPVYVEFITELNPVENLLRSNQSEGPQSGGGLAANQAKTVTTQTIRPFSLFRATGFNVDGPQGRLSDGVLPVDNITRNLQDICFGYNDPNSNLDAKLIGVITLGTQIYVARNGSWWYDYAVNVNPYRSTDWSFGDFTGDFYSLWVYNAESWHKVSYNSSDPQIDYIQFSLATISQ